jgi:serine/threonine-protein kinase
MLCPGCHHLNLDEIERCARCGRPLSEPTTELRPEQYLLGRYQLGPMLGEGAAGQVFRAHDELLGRTVALKILSRELWQSAKARQRMAREAGALGRITHRHVVGIYNVFEHESALVLELEFVEGGTLADRLRSGPLPLPEALRVMVGILSGLNAIHRAGIVHRDLKPANILLARDGTPKIADLGVARDMTAQGMTRTGTPLGTVEYMSPEQIRGDQVGPASDIYACGILLYELLTGSVPFDRASEFEVMAAHLEQAPNLSLLESKAPPVLVQAVARALAKLPEQRWASARELGKVLAKVGSHRHHGSGSGHAPRRAAVDVYPPPSLRASVVARFKPKPQGTQGRWLPVVGAVIAVILFLGVLLLGVVLVGYLAFGSNLWSHG